MTKSKLKLDMFFETAKKFVLLFGVGEVGYLKAEVVVTGRRGKKPYERGCTTRSKTWTDVVRITAQVGDCYKDFLFVEHKLEGEEVIQLLEELIEGMDVPLAICPGVSNGHTARDGVGGGRSSDGSCGDGNLNGGSVICLFGGEGFSHSSVGSCSVGEVEEMSTLLRIQRFSFRRKGKVVVQPLTNIGFV
ncbi:hypothetical protein HK104_002904 [Borealophlyctis nickersoniae]|nr:hypothetical protein HK104_002904 [Borealophlyctis nickersoniae]